VDQYFHDGRIIQELLNQSFHRILRINSRSFQLPHPM